MTSAPSVVHASQGSVPSIVASAWSRVPASSSSPSIVWLGQLRLYDDRVGVLGERIGDLAPQVRGERLNGRIDVGLGDLGAGLVDAAARRLGVRDARLAVLREALEARVGVLAEDGVDLVRADVAGRTGRRRRDGDAHLAGLDRSLRRQRAPGHDDVGLGRERLVAGGHQRARTRSPGRRTSS